MGAEFAIGTLISWWTFAIVVLCGTIVAVLAGLVWLRLQVDRSGPALAELRQQIGDLVRLPGRLRRVASDPRTPRRARWWLVGLAVYVASPIDPIPDFLPGVGLLDEVVVVPLLLARVRRMIPPEVWTEHFPPRERAIGEIG